MTVAASNAFENAFIDWFLRGQAFSLAGSTAGIGSGPTNLYLALFTENPTDAGIGLEVFGGSYARVNIACSPTNWAATDGPGTTNVPSTGVLGITSNNINIAFPAPTADWGTVTHFALMSASSGGTPLIYGSLTTGVTINNGDPAPTYPPGTLQITFS